MLVFTRRHYPHLIKFLLCNLCLWTVFVCGMQAGNADDATSFPAYVNATVVTEATNTSHNKARSLVVHQILNGKVLPERFLCEFPGNSGFYVSPSLRYVCWNTIDDSTGLGKLHVTDTQTKAVKTVMEFRSDDTFCSWSPNGKYVLFRRRHSRTPSYFVVEPAKSQVYRIISSSEDDYLLNAFWSKDGEQVIYTAIRWNGDLRRTFSSSYFYSTYGFRAFRLPRQKVISLKSEHRLTDSECRNLSGTAALKAIKKWIDKSEDGIMENQALSISLDYRNALVFGDTFHRENALWAPPDRIRFIAVMGNKTIVRDLRNHDWASEAMWSKDAKWVHYLTRDAWIWYCPGKNQLVELPATIHGKQIIDLISSER